MATIYTFDGDEITTGLQGCNVCDEAIQAAERIADLHIELEKTSKTPEQTNFLRGQIKALRLLLETEKQKQQAGQE